MRNILLTLSVLVMSFVAFTGSASAAGAGWAWKNDGGWMPNRYCAHTNCYVGKWVASNTKVYVICWMDSQYMVGNYGTSRWFRVIGPINGGYDGYMHASYIYYQPSVPRC